MDLDLDLDRPCMGLVDLALMERGEDSSSVSTKPSPPTSSGGGGGVTVLTYISFITFTYALSKISDQVQVHLRWKDLRLSKVKRVHRYPPGAWTN